MTARTPARSPTGCTMARAVAVCVAFGSVAGWCRAQYPVTPNKGAAEAVGRYLAKGAAGDALPASFRVRIEMHGVGRSVDLFEAWDFTPATIERLAWTKRGTNRVMQAVSVTNVSRIAEVCQTLAAAGFPDMARSGGIHGRGGGGPFFIGTPFIGGERKIAVTVEGQRADVLRSCWRATRDDDRDRERQFAELYGALKRLAPSPARAIQETVAAGAVGKPLPDGFSVVIETFGSSEDSAKRAGKDRIVSEAWRFRPAAVETFAANTVAKTCPLGGLREVCQALLTAGFGELVEAPYAAGDRGRLVFDGVPCSYGWRYVRVTLDGQSQTVGEGTSWPAFADAAHAERMRGLYAAIRNLALADSTPAPVVAP